MSEHSEERKALAGSWMVAAFELAANKGLSDHELLGAAVALACSMGFQMGMPVPALQVCIQEQYKLCAELGLKPKL